MKKADISNWLKQIKVWKQKYSICPPAYYEEEDVNPYVFVKALSNESVEGDTIFIDTGCTVAWMMQAFDFKEVKEGAIISHSFKVFNHGDETLRILRVRPG